MGWVVENQKMWNWVNPDILKPIKSGQLLVWYIYPNVSCRDNHETSSAWLFWPCPLGCKLALLREKEHIRILLGSTILIIFCCQRVTHRLPPKNIQNIYVQLSLHDVLYVSLYFSYISLEIITSPGDTSLPWLQNTFAETFSSCIF